MKQIKTIQVCFNMLDTYQAELYNYAKSLTNASGHFKRLLQRDYEGGREIIAAPVMTTKTVANDFMPSDFI